MINWEPGLKIAEFLANPKSESLIVGMKFERVRGNFHEKNKYLFKAPIENDTYEFWIAANQKESYDMVKAFRKYNEGLGGSVKFFPYYAFYFCTFCRLIRWNISTNTDCLSGGRYCYPDPGKVRKIIIHDF